MFMKQTSFSTGTFELRKLYAQATSKIRTGHNPPELDQKKTIKMYLQKTESKNIQKQKVNTSSNWNKDFMSTKL